MARRYTKRQVKQTTLGITGDCAALYIRVSTQKQVDEGYSLEAQRNRLVKYCESQEGEGWRVCEDHIYVDAGISGKSTDRPEYQRMLEAIDRGDVRRVVAVKLDRLSRNTKDFLTLLDYCDARKVGIASIVESFDTSTAVGRAIVTVIMAFAELERTQIAERLATGRHTKAGKGEWLGGRIPYGYKVDEENNWSIVANEAEIVRRIFAEFNAGASLSDIAKELNSTQIRTQRGGKWYASTVRYILSNGFYAGLMQYDGQDPVDGPQPFVINRTVYDSAQHRLDALRPGPVKV